MKRVRILLRVSSHQQLEADGDLSVQREIVLDYIRGHTDWLLDDREYFEGAESGYQNTVKERSILSEIEEDARLRKFDILVVYKDDRLGRRMWEIGAYVMQLKSYGVDIYTTKDGLISPDSHDIMGQMMLALRYGNAQKSSADTGQRVKDTAQKLIKQGKFMGGKAPYGYRLVLSGELSKHGRALHKLQIVPEEIEVVKKIYALSFEKEYGSAKIAKALNLDSYYRALAPNDVWKSGTISSILTNPIYCGITAYKRREKNDGKYHRLDIRDWVLATEVNPQIAVIGKELWEAVQKARSQRNPHSKKESKEKDVHVLLQNNGDLSLIDVAYCGYCGKKLTNGSSYHYWTIKSTGEKKKSKTSIYRCRTAAQGIPHYKVSYFKADIIEQAVCEKIGEYIERIQDKQDLYQVINEYDRREEQRLMQKKQHIQTEIDKIKKDIEIMKEHIPEAMSGRYPLSVKMLASTIWEFEKKCSLKERELERLQADLEEISAKEGKKRLTLAVPTTWKEVFFNADRQTKRVLIDKLVEKIVVTREKITIIFKVHIDEMANQ